MDFWIHTLDYRSSARTNCGDFCISKYPLANGDSSLSPQRGHFGDSANFKIPGLLRFQSEKGKKGERTSVKICAVPTQQNGGKNDPGSEERDFIIPACHLERREPLYAERRADGTEGREHGDGGDRWASAGAH